MICGCSVATLTWAAFTCWNWSFASSESVPLVSALYRSTAVKSFFLLRSSFSQKEYLRGWMLAMSWRGYLFFFLFLGHPLYIILSFSHPSVFSLLQMSLTKDLYNIMLNLLSFLPWSEDWCCLTWPSKWMVLHFSWGLVSHPDVDGLQLPSCFRTDCWPDIRRIGVHQQGECWDPNKYSSASYLTL